MGDTLNATMSPWTSGAEGMSERPDTQAVKDYLLDLQDRICAALEAADGVARFREDAWDRPGGRRRPHPGAWRTGASSSRAGSTSPTSSASSLPPSASADRPELAGRGFQAMGVSLVVHPSNPYVPTSHMNVRFFIAERAGAEPVWWFGGGFDLTPYYGFDEDAVHWHRTARAACAPFGEEALSPLQAVVRRVFLPEAPRRAPRDRRALLR